MFRALLVAFLGLVVVGASGAGPIESPSASSAPAQITGAASELSQLLGFVDGQLVRVDSKTLRPLSGKGLEIGSGGCAPRQGGWACWSNPPWTASPDGARLALARNDSSSLQLVGARTIRATARVRLTGGPVGALAWLAPGRVLGLEEVAGEEQRLLAVDLAKKRVVARRPLGGSVIQLGRTAQELVLLLAPSRAIGPARIAVTESRGVVRFVQLERIFAGSKLLGTGSDHRVETRLPGLAVDPEGRRAFVIDESLAAEIDLRSLSVAYHSLQRPTSLLTRVWNWLEPAASAKVISGYYRSAQWLGNDLLAVSGTDTAQGSPYEPAGLLLIDTRDWRLRTVDPGATSFRVAGELLLATGWVWDPGADELTGIGLAAYGLDGGKRFQVLDGREAWLAQVYGGFAYLGAVGQGGEALRIVDLATGRVVGTRQQPLPWLLLGPGSSWWD